MTNKCEKTVAFFKSLPQDKVTVWAEGERPIVAGEGAEVFAYAPFEASPIKCLDTEYARNNRVTCSIVSRCLEDIEIKNLKELGFVEPIKYEDVQVYWSCAETSSGRWVSSYNGYLTKSEAIKSGLECVKDSHEYSGRVGIFNTTTSTITDIQSAE